RARQMLARHPASPQLRYPLALSWAATGEREQALQEMRRSAAAEPAFVPAAVELAHWLAATSRRQNLIEACGAYHRALTAGGDEPTLRAELAQLYVQLGLKADAGVAARQAIDGAGEDAAALTVAGNALLRIGSATRALGAFEAAVEAQPTDAWAHHHRGLALTELQRFDEALTAYGRAIHLDPDLVVARIQAGRTALAMADAETAIGFLEPALPLAPDDPNLLALLGKAYLEVGRTKAALAPLQKATRLDLDVPEAPYLLARAYRGLGRPDEASAALADFQTRSDAERQRRQQDRRPDRVGAFLTRAEVYLAEDRFHEALEVLHKLTDQRPDDPHAWELMAVAFEGLGETDRAARARAEAARLRQLRG
ncbi:MAG: tetratricopeptide repeat protein, partial [Acidobacteriota bacterium]